MISVILALIFFAHCILIFTLMEVKDLITTIIKQGIFEDEPELSSYEEERQESDNLFDERIRRMSMELNLGAEHYASHIPTEAEVVEDGLYNIPHDKVNLYEMDTEETSQ